MTSTATYRTQDITGHVLFLWALPGTMSCSATIGASDSILVSQCSIEPGKFTQLHAAQIILPFRRFYSLFDNFTNLFYSFLDSLCAIRCDQSMQWFIFSREWLAIFSSNFAFFHRAFATNHDLCAGVFLQFLQSVSTWSNEETYKVDIWVLFLWNHHSVIHSLHWRLVISRWFILLI